MNATTQSKFMTFSEVVNVIGRGRNYVRKLRTAGVLNTFKPAPDVRPLYYRAEVEKLVEVK